MADHPGKIDYFGAGTIIAGTTAGVGDFFALILLPAIAIPVIGIPIAFIGLAFHYVAGAIMLASIAPSLGMTDDLKKAIPVASGGAASIADISSIANLLKYASSLLLFIAFLIPLPLLSLGLFIAILLHNGLIAKLAEQVVVIAAGVATGGAGAAAGEAAVATEAAATAAEAAATVATTGAKVAAGAAEGAMAGARTTTAGARAAGGIAKTGGQATGGAGRTMEKGAQTGRQVSKEALGEEKTPFEKLQDLFENTPGEKTGDEPEYEIEEGGDESLEDKGYNNNNQSPA